VQSFTAHTPLLTASVMINVHENQMLSNVKKYYVHSSLTTRKWELYKYQLLQIDHSTTELLCYRQIHHCEKLAVDRRKYCQLS